MIANISHDIKLFWTRFGSKIFMASSKAGQVLSVARNGVNAITGLGKEMFKVFKAPWKVTGPVSSSEFRESIIEAGMYRPVSPASYSKPKIPHAEPNTVYDIKYYSRDTRRMDLTRRLDLYEHGKVQDPIETVPEASASESAESTAPVEESTPLKIENDLPPTPGKFYIAGRSVHLNDNNGSNGLVGYT